MYQLWTLGALDNTGELTKTGTCTHRYAHTHT
jgi:hypothetical protein